MARARWYKAESASARRPSTSPEMLRASGASRRGSGPLLLLLLLLVAHANSLPIQYLPNIPGYIPVYIRHGNEPLDQVHPGLAEAFHEPSGTLQNVQDNPLETVSSKNNDLSERNDVSLDVKEEESAAQKNAKPSISSKHFIYNLPLKKSIFHQKSKPSEKESVVMKINAF